MSQELAGSVLCMSGERHVSVNGFDYYFDKEGELHRTDGPAVSNGVGGESYWLHGKMVEKGDIRLLNNNDIEELFTL
jgi:hypothetical protein